MGMVHFGIFCSRLSQNWYIQTFFYAYNFSSKKELYSFCVYDFGGFPPQNSYI
jgi:hypothetical protein